MHLPLFQKSLPRLPVMFSAKYFNTKTYISMYTMYIVYNTVIASCLCLFNKDKFIDSSYLGIISSSKRLTGLCPALTHFRIIKYMI